MNPLILKIVTSLLHHSIDFKISSLKSKKNGEDFFLIVKNILNSSKQTPLQRYSETYEPRFSYEKKSPHFYLEALRRRLLEMEKPLSKLTLSREDLPLFKKFLYHCGFSQEKVDLFLKDLRQDNLGGDVNLSQIFLKIDTLMPVKKKYNQNATLEPSAIPHIESILRSFGFTPKELDSVFNSARIESGQIDLSRLVIKLKEAGGKGRSENRTTLNSTSIDTISNKPEEPALSKTDREQAGQITLKDFISSLEQNVGDLAQENKLPLEVKADIEQILGRVVLSEERYVSEEKISLLASLGNRRNLKDKKSLSAAFKNEDGPAEKGDLLSSIDKKDNPVDEKVVLSHQSEKENKKGKKTLWSSFDKKDKINSNNRSSNTVTFNEKNESEVSYDSDNRRNINKAAGKNGYGIKLETVTANSTNHTAGPVFSKVINTVKQNENPVKDFLPAYLVDQVGKQISKSILRGDNILKLRLKPPELGVVRIKMDIKDNILKLGMITENNEVKDLFLSNVFELRETLMEQGVKLEKIDIQITHDFDQSLTNSEKGLKEGQNRRHGPNRDPLAAKNIEEGVQSEFLNMKADKHLLDLVA